MSMIDVAIPGVAGLLALACPRWLCKSSGDAEKDAASEQKVRVCGIVLLLVAGVYFGLK